MAFKVRQNATILVRDQGSTDMGRGPDFIKNRENTMILYFAHLQSYKSDVYDFVVSHSVTALPIKKL